MLGQQGAQLRCGCLHACCERSEPQQQPRQHKAKAGTTPARPRTHHEQLPCCCYVNRKGPALLDVQAQQVQRQRDGQRTIACSALQTRTDTQRAMCMPAHTALPAAW